MQYVLVGMLVRKSAKGNIGTTIIATTEFDSYQQESSLVCEGNDCVREYISGDYSSTLEVGQKIKLVYGRGYQDKAVLREIIPVEE